MNCAAGFSCFDRPIYTLVNGSARLKVRKVVDFHKIPNLPDKFIIGSINPENLGTRSEK